MLFYMVAFCYPMNVFLWGDYGEHYTALKERRKLIRNIIVVGGWRCCFCEHSLRGTLAPLPCESAVIDGAPLFCRGGGNQFLEPRIVAQRPTIDPLGATQE
jgi:hypothetical protein